MCSDLFCVGLLCGSLRVSYILLLWPGNRKFSISDKIAEVTVISFCFRQSKRWTQEFYHYLALSLTNSILQYCNIDRKSPSERAFMRKRPVCNLWQQLVYLLRWPFCSGPICKTFSVCFKYETKIFCQSISLNRFLQTELSASRMAVCSQELLGIILLTDQFLETLPVYL